jgi:hypothetical protein
LHFFFEETARFLCFLHFFLGVGWGVGVVEVGVLVRVAAMFTRRLGTVLKVWTLPV